MSRKSKWQDEIGDITKELRRGPLSTKTLTKKVADEGYGKSARKRISRHLKKLKKWDLVEKKEEKWYWFEHIQSFESREDYEQTLNHSKKLMEDASEKLPSVGVDKLIFDYEPLCKHIQTGYPQIHETVEEAKTLREKVKKKEKSLEKLIIKKIEENSFVSNKEKQLEEGGVNHEHIAEIILYHSPDDRPRPDLDDIDVDDEGWIRHHSVRSDAIASSEHVSLDEVKELLLDIAESKEIRKVMKSFNQIQEKLRRKKSELDGKFSYLKRKVEHGEPLRGSCSLCPKIKIK